MKRYVIIIIVLTSFALPLQSQEILSIDNCRALAVANNKDLLISNERINSAYYEKKAAFTSYLPHLTATGTYMHNQKNLSMLSDDQKAGLSHMGSTVNEGVQDFAQQISTQYPTLAPLISSLGSNLADPLNVIGQSAVDALHTNTRNVYAGALTLTQPLYMGGKIRAYNKITRYAEELAREQHHSGLQEVILDTDQAYWQVVSLVNKKKLAESYLTLLQKLDNDMERMIAEGVATRSDGLSVKVKVNEAEMTLTKVNDALSLARMLLCQICGLELHKPVVLADEQIDDIGVKDIHTGEPDMESVYAKRPEIRSLELGTKIYQQKVNLTRSDHLPTVALMGNYMVTNPSMYNGFETKFRGMWNVGVMVQVPLWTWGEGTYKVRSAKAEALISRYQLEDAKEKVELQVNQSVYKVNEAYKNLAMTGKNMENADENLRSANLGFKEGVIPVSNLIEAQTAWLSAHSDKIDAQINMKITDLYLQKAMGTLEYQQAGE